MRLRIRRLPFLPLLLTCALIKAAGDSAPVVSLVPEAGTDHLFPIVAQGSGRLKWSQGAFVYNTAQYFFTLSPEGDVTQKAILDEPQDAHYSITDFDRKSDGSIVAAAFPDDDNISPFIAWIAPDGKTEKIIKTAPYYPRLLTFAQDGTVWTLGWEAIHMRTHDPALDPSDGVLRQFDRGGKMIASALPQRDTQISRIEFGKLCALHEHLVWYSSIRGKARYIEIPTDKIELHIFPGLPPNLFKSDSLDGGVEAFAVMDSGNAVVSLRERERHAAFLLDRTTGQWIRLAVPSFAGFTAPPRLAGTDEDRLVFATGTSAAFFTPAN